MSSARRIARTGNCLGLRSFGCKAARQFKRPFEVPNAALLLDYAVLQELD